MCDEKNCVVETCGLAITLILIHSKIGLQKLYRVSCSCLCRFYQLAGILPLCIPSGTEEHQAYRDNHRKEHAQSDYTKSGLISKTKLTLHICVLADHFYLTE
jgi:hypothetical protein